MAVAENVHLEGMKPRDPRRVAAWAAGRARAEPAAATRIDRPLTAPDHQPRSNLASPSRSMTSARFEYDGRTDEPRSPLRNSTPLLIVVGREGALSVIGPD